MAYKTIMSESCVSLTMPRILGMEKKNRVQVRSYVENEILHAMKKHTLDFNDTLNLALEKHLKDKGIVFHNSQ